MRKPCCTTVSATWSSPPRGPGTRRHGETVRKRTTGAFDDLPPQEARIARLAVSGRTNPKIGAVLFLNPRTVERHPRKVFTKLGIASSRELAATLRDR
jgi:DNA-binding NarL/FixJ family response regulator